MLGALFQHSVESEDVDLVVVEQKMMAVFVKHFRMEVDG